MMGMYICNEGCTYRCTKDEEDGGGALGAGERRRDREQQTNGELKRNMQWSSKIKSSPLHSTVVCRFSSVARFGWPACMCAMRNMIIN
jgi:hypothetical protein